MQAASALGQARLQRVWDEALGREGLAAAQVLLTAIDVADRAGSRRCIATGSFSIEKSGASQDFRRRAEGRGRGDRALRL